MRRKILFVLCAAGLILANTPISINAATSVSLTTPYPAVSVEAGKTVTFNLEVRTPGRDRVDLSILEAPPGWQTQLKGGGFIVNSVFGTTGTKDDPPPSLQLEVKIPPDAAKADYKVIVRAASPPASSTLTVNIRVAEVASGAVSLAAEFPSLRGSADTPFKFNLTLTNNTPESLTFDLSGQGPEGWRVTARPTTQAQASTVKVDGGGSATIEAEADPPDNVTAGKYDIKVLAQAGQNRTEATVVAEVTGNVTLSLSTPNDRLNAAAKAGKTSELTLVVQNDGTSPVENVKLSATPPSQWRVTFSPETIRKIDPKKSQQVTARITPAGDAVAGDYVISMRAEGGGGSDDVEIRTTVETSLIWGFTGLVVIALAGFVLFRVFRQYGRR